MPAIPCPLIYTVRDRQWRLLETVTADDGRLSAPGDLPLGIFEHGTYAELQLKLDVGDLVLFYTDALIESRGANGDLLGSNAFLEIVAKLNGGQPETLLGQIVANVTSLHPGNLTEDDVTLLLFRATWRGSSFLQEPRVGTVSTFEREWQFHC